jgi:hypothetical protein
MRKEWIRGTTKQCNRQEEDEVILRQTEVQREWRARASSGGKILSAQLSSCAALVLKTRVLGKALLYVADKRTTAFSHILLLIHENLQLRPRRCYGCALFAKNLADWKSNIDKNTRDLLKWRLQSGSRQNTLQEEEEATTSCVLQQFHQHHQSNICSS